MEPDGPSGPKVIPFNSSIWITGNTLQPGEGDIGNVLQLVEIAAKRGAELILHRWRETVEFRQRIKVVVVGRRARQRSASWAPVSILLTLL